MTFPSLIHIVKLDLSKNQLTSLPPNFGELRNLKQLDLYSNKVDYFLTKLLCRNLTTSLMCLVGKGSCQLLPAERVAMAGFEKQPACSNLSRSCWKMCRFKRVLWCCQESCQTYDHGPYRTGEEAFTGTGSYQRFALKLISIHHNTGHLSVFHKGNLFND